jgi:hypothetical protein
LSSSNARLEDEAHVMTAPSGTARNSTSERGTYVPKIYDDEGALLMQADEAPERVVLLPAGDPHYADPQPDRIRVQWGQHLLADLLARRYRTFICAVNTEVDSKGIIAQVAEALPASQWNAERIRSYCRMFADSISGEDELVLKFDMDAIEVLALLRPPARDYFTLKDLATGFRVVSEMLAVRSDRLPCAAVSFLGAKGNILRDSSGKEPSFETVLRIMWESGYRGDVYPSWGMWELAPTGLFASYPFPESLDRMRTGGY